MHPFTGSTTNKVRDLAELAVSYGLILLVIWTPRPWQRLLWLITVAFVITMTSLSFKGFRPCGLKLENLWRSLWIVGAALALAGIAIWTAGRMHTLKMPSSTILFARSYAGYAVWAFLQEFLMLAVFLERFRRVVSEATWAACASAAIFAIAHLPNPFLTAVTLIWGMAACLLFLRYQNLFPLAAAHAILGIAIAITIPGPVDHNMRVGLGYLEYQYRPAPVMRAPNGLAQP